MAFPDSGRGLAVSLSVKEWGGGRGASGSTVEGVREGLRGGRRGGGGRRLLLLLLPRARARGVAGRGAGSTGAGGTPTGQSPVPSFRRPGFARRGGGPAGGPAGGPGTSASDGGGCRVPHLWVGRYSGGVRLVRPPPDVSTLHSPPLSSPVPPSTPFHPPNDSPRPLVMT